MARRARSARHQVGNGNGIVRLPAVPAAGFGLMNHMYVETNGPGLHVITGLYTSRTHPKRMHAWPGV